MYPYLINLRNITIVPGIVCTPLYRRMAYQACLTAYPRFPDLMFFGDVHQPRLPPSVPLPIDPVVYVDRNRLEDMPWLILPIVLVLVMAADPTPFGPGAAHPIPSKRQ